MRPTRSVRAVRAATSLNEGEPRLLPVAIFLLIAGCAQALPTTSQPAPASVAFVGVTVVPMTGGDSILADRTVLVRDGLIVAIGSAALVEVPAGALRIDARGQYLMPGLIDSHVHLEYFDDPRILGLAAGRAHVVVHDREDQPFVNVPVFLDRGTMAIERYTTDSAGTVQFPLQGHEVQRAVWLICAHGAIPMVGMRRLLQAGPTTYGYTPLQDST